MNEKFEEILEAIWVASESSLYSLDAIRERCAIAFTAQDLADLQGEGMIIQNEGKILFTNEGKILAEGIIRRHRLAEVLVTSILKMKSLEMEKIACQVEHCLLPEVEESICTLLGHPELCPDGKPIPKGRCCDRGQKVVNSTVVSLAELKPGEKGKITYIKPGSHSNLHQLISFGLTPGVMVTVHRKSPAFCIKFENTELALDEEIVKNIFVWRLVD
ncbi:MAG: metal-dependent transcriptional regulator [Desulfobulbaceae bacterium]|nr:metal-dependent transcriptional regulator [Desulfobulbaceae bacterium]